MKRLVLPLALAFAACSEPPPPSPPPPPPDTSAAEISELQVTPDKVGRAGTVNVTFKFSEELHSLTVRVAGNKAECTVEELAASCTATLSGAEPEGPQPVEVFAMDLAGNGAKATATVTTDYTAPTLTLASRPAALTNDANPAIDFAADEEGVTYTCAVDDGEAEPCTPPFTASGLTEGPHAVRITATDAQGNSGSMVVAFSVDLTAPETMLLTEIPSLTRHNAHTVSFTSDDERATFECRLDDAAFATCASPFALTALAEGAHTFEVRAVDEAGNADPAPPQIDFTVDQTPPVTTVVALPTDGGRDVSIPFSVDDPSATVECSIDGSPFVPCSSPFEVAGLTDGEHAVMFRAIDPAGNAESPPVAATFVVDRTPPQTTIISVPAASPTRETSATFEFTATETPNTFECSLDGEAFAPCTSPTTVTVAHGEHVFEVRALDAYGNFDLTPARFTWTVDTVAPVVSFDPPVPALHLQPTLTVSFVADEEVSGFECSLDGEPFAACSNPHTLTDLTATLGTGNPHVISVRAIDLAGNTGSPTSASFDVDLSVLPPAVPVVEPLVPSIVSNTTPTLVWHPAENAEGYDLEISTTPDFSADVESYDLLMTSHVMSPRDDGKYFYRVRSKNSTGPSAWSQTYLVQVSAWAQVHPLPVSDALYGMACRSADECVMAGTASAIVRTMDGGRSFQRIASPAPVASTAYFGIALADTNTLVAIGSNGVISRSTDFGASWTLLTHDVDGDPLPTGTWNSVYFNGRTGIIGGASGNVLLSTDAGASWKVLTKPHTSAINYALVVETSPSIRLVAHTASAVFYSTDGGETWAASSVTGTFGSANEATMAADGTIFIVGGTSRIWRSTDKGESFTLVNNGGPTIEVAHGIDANTLLVAGANTATDTPVRRATIGIDSTTFEQATRIDPGSSMLNPNPTLRTIWVDENLNGFATGFNGAIWRITADASGVRLSTPPGATANPVSMSSSTVSGAYKNIQFIDENVGFATGPGSATSATTQGQFARTIDGGRSWTPIDLSPDLTNDQFQDIHFFDALNGIGVGGANRALTEGGTVVNNAPWAARTSDGGLTWTTLELPEAYHVANKHLRSVAFANPDVGFAVGDEKSSSEDTVVFAWNSTDNRFEVMPVVDEFGAPTIKGVKLQDVELFDATTGYAVGSKGNIFRYDAAGARWVLDALAGPDLNAVAFVDAETVVAVGKNGSIYRRALDQFGVPQWTHIPAPEGITVELHDVVFYGQTGYIAGASSRLLVSTDGGLTWTAKTGPVSTNYSIVRVGPNEFFVGGNTSRQIFRTEVGLR